MNISLKVGKYRESGIGNRESGIGKGDAIVTPSRDAIVMPSRDAVVTSDPGLPSIITGIKPLDGVFFSWLKGLVDLFLMALL